MKRFILSILMALFLFSSLTVYAAEVKSLKGVAVVDADSLNIRSGPSKDHDRLGVLVKDASVEVVGIVEPDWYVIKFEGKEGYINSKYVVFTPQEEIEGGIEFISKEYLVMALVVAILIVSGGIVYTVIHMRKSEDDEDEEIPISSHDDTNMHMGEVSYDTYRIDIDPKYFEQTTVIPQPESIYDENGNVPWKKELFGEEIAEEHAIKETLTSGSDIQTLDSKLEQASAQIAALQKEVEQLKKQNPGSK